jgi:acid phosphatase type 7
LGGSLPAGQTSIAVDWVTTTQDTLRAAYGTSAHSLTSVVAATTLGNLAGIGYQNQAEFVNLTAGTQYFYTLGTDATVRNFTTLPSTRQANVVVLADHGYVAGQDTVAELLKQGAAGAFDFVIHAGDMAYDLDSSNSATGNDYLNLIQPVAASYPWVAVPGNHEEATNFTEFQQRFRATALTLGKAAGTNTNIYYSFNVGLIHFLAFSTEVWDYYPDAGEQQRMLDFMAADLKAVDRSQTPWVVAFGHKATPDMPTRWDLLEPVLNGGGVDLYFAGHIHNTVRYAPCTWEGTPRIDWASVGGPNNSTYTNPALMTTIIIGGAGNTEGNSDCASAETVEEVWCSQQYGFGNFHAVNASVLQWNFVQSGCFTGSGCPTGSDSLTLIQHNHGPRN